MIAFRFLGSTLVGSALICGSAVAQEAGRAPVESPPVSIAPPTVANQSAEQGTTETPTRRLGRRVFTINPETREVREETPVVTEPRSVSSDVPTATSAPPVVTVAPGGTALSEPAVAPSAVPASPAGESKPENPWAKIPPVTVFSRPGYFLVPPTGPGYYSGLDCLLGRCREKPPAFPWAPFALQPPGFFDADFRYLDKPDNQQHDLFDCTKRIRPNDCTMLSVGGGHWLRYMNEVDSRLGRVDNSYLLSRNRVYADFWYRDLVRVYGEFIAAHTVGQELAPLPIDQNRADLLNLFADVKLADINGSGLYGRIGRQELIYGSQRLVSTLDWANTRRTFEGAKLFWHSEKFDLDAFWTRPVLAAPAEFDSADQNQQFFGAWATWRPEKGQFFDLYYLGHDNTNIAANPLFPAAIAPRGGFNIHTFGARSAGNRGDVLYEVEGMLQTGSYIGQDHRAYAWSAGLGYVFSNLAWRPQFWVGNEYASGTSNPTGSTHGTFHQLFPFGHYYHGFIDVVGRQNINDFNLQMAFYPQPWIVCLVQYHNFQLANNRDFLYNAAGRPTRRSAAGTAGRNVGDEVDFLINLHLTTHQDVLFGYSKLFAGDFIKNTGAPVSPELFYLMYNFRW